MRKALTPRNRKFKGDLDPAPQQISDSKQSTCFPSYFGNFGIFTRLLTLQMLAPLTRRRFRQEHEFPVMTAFMAIV
jgi:hypothetical protein